MGTPVALFHKVYILLSNHDDSDLQYTYTFWVETMLKKKFLASPEASTSVNNMLAQNNSFTNAMHASVMKNRQRFFTNSLLDNTPNRITWHRTTQHSQFKMAGLSLSSTLHLWAGKLPLPPRVTFLCLSPANSSSFSSEGLESPSPATQRTIRSSPPDRICSVVQCRSSPKYLLSY